MIKHEEANTELNEYLQEVRKVMKYCFIMVRVWGLEKSIELLKLADEVIKENEKELEEEMK